MSIPEQATEYRYCGRVFTPEDIGQIRDLMAAQPKTSRYRLSFLVCEQLGWFRPDGRPKDMSCRVAMLRMERDGLIKLPPPQHATANGKIRPRLTSASDPQFPLTMSAGALKPLTLDLVKDRRDSRLWNELIERHHYLGYKPLPGAQLRYLVSWNHHLLAALGFGASAWKVAPRDQFIGWSHEQRKTNLHLIVNNARFLILPWVTSKNLASKILGAVVKRIPQDWEKTYGYAPVLMETFVEKNRFKGICYKAANWIHVGQTQGRGKLDRYTRRQLPVKDIFLYPLQRKRFRKKLCSGT